MCCYSCDKEWPLEFIRPLLNLDCQDFHASNMNYPAIKKHMLSKEDASESLKRVNLSALWKVVVVFVVESIVIVLGLIRLSCSQQVH